MEFNVGDRVKIEGILIANPNEESAFPFILETKNSFLTFTKAGSLNYREGSDLEMVEKFVPKKAHYKVLYKKHGLEYITAFHYSSEKDFEENASATCKFMQLLESTKEMR